jgi:hypothetical protein
MLPEIVTFPVALSIFHELPVVIESGEIVLL